MHEGADRLAYDTYINYTYDAYVKFIYAAYANTRCLAILFRQL